MNLSLKFFVILLALACFGAAVIWKPSHADLKAAGLLLWLAAETFG